VPRPHCHIAASAAAKCHCSRSRIAATGGHWRCLDGSFRRQMKTRRRQRSLESRDSSRGTSSQTRLVGDRWDGIIGVARWTRWHWPRRPTWLAGRTGRSCTAFWKLRLTVESTVRLTDLITRVRAACYFTYRQYFTRLRRSTRCEWHGIITLCNTYTQDSTTSVTLWCSTLLLQYSTKNCT